jgi:hypothetical protein
MRYEAKVASKREKGPNSEEHQGIKYLQFLVSERMYFFFFSEIALPEWQRGGPGGGRQIG